MAPKGVSAAEKRERLKGLLVDGGPGPQVLTLKQLEKLGVKLGINGAVIKDVVTELVGDNEIEQDKIGSTNYYWCFPSKELSVLQATTSKLQAEAVAAEAELAELQRKRLAAEAVKVPSAERTANLARLAKERAELATIERDTADKVANDPSKKLDEVRQLDICKAAANRWTDNTWVMEAYLRKTMGATKQDALNTLGMADDFDYPVFKPKGGKKK
jgi:hypothetical protein